MWVICQIKMAIKKGPALMPALDMVSIIFNILAIEWIGRIAPIGIEWSA